MSKHQLRFPIDYVVRDIQNKVLQKYKKELNFFNNKIKSFASGDIALMDKLIIIPHMLLQEGIQKSALVCLNQPRSHFFISDMEIPLKR